MHSKALSTALYGANPNVKRLLFRYFAGVHDVLREVSKAQIQVLGGATQYVERLLGR